MDRAPHPWIQLLLLLMMMMMMMMKMVPAVTVVPLTELESPAGRLVFYQTERDQTFVRDAGQLASDVPTETALELLDPDRSSASAPLTYSWDLGNGEVIQGTEPLVRYLYPRSGNYTLRLKVAAAAAPAATTAVYSQEVRVLDAIRRVELDGPADFALSQDSSLALHVDGSPPIWLCWRFLRSCVVDPAAGCTLTVLQDGSLALNHTFASVGVHCLDVSVRNHVSQLQTTFSLLVRRNDHTHLLFILACAAVLVATFAFILVFACRPWQQHKSQGAASFLKNRDSAGHSRIVLTFTSAEKGENVPLLLQPQTPQCP